MSRQLILCVALLLLPVATMTQTTVNDKMESGTANARIIAARKALSAVTAQQCLADLSSWEAKDDADTRAKVEYPNYWYQKLSTEELVRLSSESVSCGSVLSAHHRGGVPIMRSYQGAFDSVLLFRAEAVLVEHYLMNEYLLKSSQ